MYGSGPGKVVCMVLEWTPEEPSLFQDRPFSAVTSVYTSRETWETQNHRTFSSTSLLGTLGPGDRRLCMRLALHVHYRPFSVTSKERLRE